MKTIEHRLFILTSSLEREREREREKRNKVKRKEIASRMEQLENREKYICNT